MLMDTNPWLLALTAVVTILHSVFDFLAFKNGVCTSHGRGSRTTQLERSVSLDQFPVLHGRRNAHCSAGDMPASTAF